MKKLNFIIKNVKLKTGIDVMVHSVDMKYILADEPIILPNKSDFLQVYASKEQNRTFFKFRYNENDYMGSLSGADKVAENYAYLILSLIENYNVEPLQVTKSEMIKKIVSGEASIHEVESFTEENEVIFNNFFCLAISQDKAKIGETLNYLNKNKRTNYDLITAYDDKTIAYIKLEPDNENKIQAEKFALSLYSEIYRDLGEKVVIGVGTNKSRLIKANTSFNEAIIALKMNSFLYNNSSVHSYTNFMLIRLLEDLPKYRLKEITANMLDEEGEALFADEEMLRTASVLMENNLNISEASRALYMHRNTLTYRLDKIEKVTNLNIRNFHDAVTFRILSIIKKIAD